MGLLDDWHHLKHISLVDVRRRLNVVSLPERRQILDYIHRNLEKIRPHPDADWLYDEISTYLIVCIVRQDKQADECRIADDAIHSRFEAAHELVNWFNWYVTNGNVSDMSVRTVVDRIELVFRDGDDKVKNCIETGFLEHVLETPRNREFFAHWAGDPLLAQSYTEAMRWGQAHSKPQAP